MRSAVPRLLTLVMLALVACALPTAPTPPGSGGPPGPTISFPPGNGPVVVNPSGPLAPAELHETPWGTFTQNVALTLSKIDNPQASVPHRDKIRGEVRSAPLPTVATYAVVIGVSREFCGSNSIGSIGHIKLEVSQGATILQNRLVPADATRWMDGACHMDAFEVTLPPGGFARYTVEIEAGLPGKFLLTTFIELDGADHTADAFRDGFVAEIEVI